MTVRITCINKEQGHHDDPHAAISTLGWVDEGTNKTGRSTRVDMHNWVAIADKSEARPP
jgi:hypothetical protein